MRHQIEFLAHGSGRFADLFDGHNEQGLIDTKRAAPIFESGGIGDVDGAAV